MFFLKNIHFINAYIFNIEPNKKYKYLEIKKYEYIYMKKTFNGKKVLRKNKTRKNKIDKNKIHKKKLVIGGDRPKINFPYTYFILTYTIIKSIGNMDVFVEYMNIQTQKCDDIANPMGKSTKHVGNVMPQNENEALILVLKYDDFLLLERDSINNLLNINFLNKILGHAKIIYYPKQKMIAIYNVCLHKLTYIETSKQFVEKTDRDRGNYGSVLFNCILTGIKFLPNEPPNDFNTLWLGIDMRNVNFSKVAWLYVSNGFFDPVLSNVTPDGTQIGFNIMGLTNNFYYVNNTSDVRIYHHEIMDLYYQYHEKYIDVSEGILSFKFYFDKSALRTLRLLPFLSFSEDKIPLGINAFESQLETSGTFYIYDSEKEKDTNTYVYKLSLEMEDDEKIKYQKGNAFNVPIEPASGRGNFHTHPFNAYKTEQVIIGPPSYPDIHAYLNYLNKDIMNNEETIKFHAVITIEGIYIFSLSKNGIKLWKGGYLANRIKSYIDRGRTDFLRSYEYPFKERKYNWDEYDIDDRVDNDRVEKEVNKYLAWFNEVNNALFEGGLLNMQFFSWKQLGQDETKIDIVYYSHIDLDDLDDPEL